MHQRMRRWAIAGCCCLLSLLAACTVLGPLREAPQVTLAGLSLTDADLFVQHWRLRLLVRNPNAVDLPVDRLDFTIEVNGEALADGRSEQAVTVPAGGDAVVEVAATSTLGGLARLLRGQRQGLDYRIRGTLDAGAYGRFPFDRRGRIDPGAPVPPSPENLPERT